MGAQPAKLSKVRPRVAAGVAWQSHRVSQQVGVEVAREVRRQVFGQAEPPFATLQAAGEWVQQQAPSAWDEREAVQQLDAFLERVRKALPRPPGPWAGVGLVFEIVRLELGPGMHVPAQTEPLRLLADASSRLADLAGWGKDGAARFILTGAVPALKPKVSWSLTRAGLVRVHLTIFPWQLHPAEWARLRHKAERGLLRGVPRLSGVQRRLLDLIAHLGPPPPSRGRGRRVGRVAYWQRVAREWSKTYRQRRAWNTVWKLYARLPRQFRTESEEGRR